MNENAAGSKFAFAALTSLNLPLTGQGARREVSFHRYAEREVIRHPTSALGITGEAWNEPRYH